MLAARGREQEALALIERAIAIGREHPPTRSFSRALYNLSYQFAARDRHLDALEIDREGLEVAQRRGQRVEELMALGHIGSSLTVLGRWDEALAVIENIDVNASTRAASDCSMKVLILVHRGDIAAARREYDLIADYFDDAELQMLAGRLHIEGHVLLAEGRLADALDTARRGYQVCLDGGFTFHHPFTKWLLQLCFDSALELDDRETFDQLMRTVDAARPVDRTPLLDAVETVSRGRLHALDGDLQQAEPLLRQGARQFELLNMLFEQARALYELGCALVTAEQQHEAAATLAQARTIFAQLNASPWIERVNAVGSAAVV